MTVDSGPFARRTFTAADFADDPADRPAVETRSFTDEEFRAEPRTLSATADDTTIAETPIYARSAKKKDAGSMIPKAALVAVPALVLAAGAIYLMSRPSSDGLFAENAAQAPAPAVASAPPLAPSAQQAAPIQQAAMPEVAPPITAPPVAERAAPEPRAQAPVRTARAAAPAPALVDADNPQNWATDASATLPDAPIPYSAIGQTSASSPAAAAPPLLTLDPAPEAVTETPPAATMPATPQPQAPASPEGVEAPIP
jgi:hypothetical protein